MFHKSIRRGPARHAVMGGPENEKLCFQKELFVEWCWTLQVAGAELFGIVTDRRRFHLAAPLPLTIANARFACPSAAALYFHHQDAVDAAAAGSKRSVTAGHREQPAALHGFACRSKTSAKARRSSARSAES